MNKPPNTDNRHTERLGVSPRKIRNDRKYPAAVDSLAERFGASLRYEILSGTSKFTHKVVVAIAALPPDEQAAAIERVRTSTRRKVPVSTVMPATSQPTTTNDTTAEVSKGTPPFFLERLAIEELQILYAAVCGEVKRRQETA